MDVIFSCPKCEQELAVDSSGSGSEINCPSCGEPFIIPEPGGAARLMRGPGPSAPSRPASSATAAGSSTPDGHRSSGSSMAGSAAAKVELHLKVPSNKTTESLIAKALPPLEVAAKDTEKKLKVKTIRHTDCVEVGKDKFDEVVSGFLVKVGETNIVNINTLTYTVLDIGSQKLMTEFGVLIVYKG